MKLLKRRLSILIVMLMIITAISPVSLAEWVKTQTTENINKVDEGVESGTGVSDVSRGKLEVEASDVLVGKSETEAEAPDNLEEKPETFINSGEKLGKGLSDGSAKKGREDEIIYNLGSQEIIVGYDNEQAETIYWAYKLFDENNNYMIELEDNAFFPYEVQFKFGDKTIVEWFNTPESTVQIGEHIFSVHSEMNDDTKLSQIGMWVGDEYVAARPEPKNFTNSMFQPFSLLPLEEIYVTLDLTSYNYFQLKNCKISTILSNLLPEQNIDEDAKIVWTRLYYDEHEIVEQAGVIDLSEISSSSFSLELIVGSALQIDYNNIRYIVDVTKSSKGVIGDDITIYKEVQGERSKVEPINVDRYISSGSYNEYIDSYLTKNDINADVLYVGLKLDSIYDSFNSIKAYRGSYGTLEDIEIAIVNNTIVDVTDKLLNEDMTEDGAGFDIVLEPNYNWYQETFSLVFKENEIKYIYRVHISIDSNNSVYAYGNLYAEDSTYSNIVRSTIRKMIEGIEIYTYTLERGYSADDMHYLRLEYVYGGNFSDENRLYITKAVLGHFDTEEEVLGEVDIKEQLFPSNTSAAGSGYAANYSGKGQDFTVFAEGEVFKLTIKAEDSKPEGPEEIEKPLPNPGSNDTYFRVKGASELYNTYVLPYKHDTYYDMGYQTVFYLDEEVELSELRPIFWVSDRVNVYSGHSGDAGILQESGATELDFSGGPVQYAAAAEDGVSLKNYWVTFVNKNKDGARLFVNGINGDEGSRREVFLTSRHDNIHDIFIANVGNAELTGLNAVLTDALNIKLDPYWTVGSENNDSLKAFDSISKDSSYGELDNVAKIRLIPDGEGEISGALTITADGQEPVIITLTGNAGDPRLTTQDIPEAVKYVPYAVQILHNNKYNWNTVTLEKISGSLPEGIALKPNGELYGVPTETGEFRFQVRMENSDPRFRDSIATYTLVVEENTNDNVDRSTDEGYGITKRIGKRIGNDDVVTTISDHEFITDGERNEFIDFWLNGERLIKDRDYIEDDGSTKITIRSQTFKNKANQKGVNTIAAEFRVDGSEDKDLKRAAQNFKIDIKSQSGGGSGDTSTSDISTPEPKPEPEQGIELEPIVEQVITVPDPIINSIEIQAIIEGDLAEAKTTITALGEALSYVLDEIEVTEEDRSAIIELIIIGFTDDIITVNTLIPLKFIKDIAKTNNNISLKINSEEIGTVILGSSAINAIALYDGDNIEIDISRNCNEVSVNICLDNLILDRLNGDIKVVLPYMADGEVIVLFKADGEEKIVKKSIVKAGNVYALLDGSGIIKVIDNSKDFNDIEITDWFCDPVLFVNSRELFIGVNETDFAPNSHITRAMIATILHRLEENENSDVDNIYNDVDLEQWYSDGVSWVAGTDIMAGYGNGEFGINDALNREQLATVMYNYANYIGLNTIERGKIQQFSDIKQTSPWAYDAVRWAVGVGLIQGHDNILNPKGEATRAETATIIMRFIDVLVR